MKFSLGRLVATPGVVESVPHPELMIAINRHAQGDWGDLEDEDKRANDRALVCGDRLLSAYVVGNSKLYVITEHDRSLTTVLLASEY